MGDRPDFPELEKVVGHISPIIEERVQLRATIAALEAERDTLKAEVARLTDPDMKCRDCLFNLTAELATRDAVIRELCGALENLEETALRYSQDIAYDTAIDQARAALARARGTTT